MGGRGLSRRRTTRESSHPPTPRRKLATLVSALKSQAVSAVRRVARRRPSGRAKTPPTSRPTKSPPATRLKRTSVVRTPPRGPSLRARKPAAAKSPATIAITRPKRTIASTTAPIPQPTSTPAPADARPSPPPFEPPRTRTLEEQFSIPTGYGEDRIVLMVKDPWWLFAYWEIQPATERSARSQLLPHEVAGLQSILRIYDVTGIEFPSQPAHRSFDISLSGLATNWYVPVNAPNRSFIVELGLLTHTGRFLLLARSNRVTTPRFGPSEVIDEAWMTTDETYWKLLSRWAGLGPGSSPLEWSRAMAHAVSSDQRASANVAGRARPSVLRGFWCRINADLVIHGATEPKASVMIQGHPVSVRKDGTFSLRLALPEGAQTITIEVTSADGRQMRTVTPVVTLAWSGTLASDGPTVKGRMSRPLSGTGGG